MKLYIALLLSSLVLYSCSSSPNSEHQKNDLAFNVDENILDASYIDTLKKIQLRVPKGWIDLTELPDNELKLKFSSLVKIDSTIKSIFVDTLNNASLFYRVINIQSNTLERIFNNPDSAYNSQQQWSSILKSNFILNGISVSQFLLQSNDLVNFRLISRENSPHQFQIDYILSRESYLLQVKKVESSIGSTRRL